MGTEWWQLLIVGAPGLVAGVVAFFKIRPESRRLSASTAAELMAAAGDLAGDFRQDMTDLRERLRSVEQHQKRWDRMLRTHHDWDVHLVARARTAGVEVSDPPPLWMDEEE
jgi:hypothetical protein